MNKPNKNKSKFVWILFFVFFSFSFWQSWSGAVICIVSFILGILLVAFDEIEKGE